MRIPFIYGGFFKAQMRFPKTSFSLHHSFDLRRGYLPSKRLHVGWQALYFYLHQSGDPMTDEPDVETSPVQTVESRTPHQPRQQMSMPLLITERTPEQYKEESNGSGDRNKISLKVS
ncbi:CFC_HP_G0025120.mRNA.1.CDS.1 [Saccharomyces cerevisiae]|nr:CFC_HP_G0025120.mRNA.1.CDS.1 [Saccharomyces cerevisiae]CAI6944649.1 CFC_HP_G0025120.mRNA.1.CDS.1 [Saccharomyces cerevisiae]